MLSTFLIVISLVVLGSTQPSDPATLEASIKFAKNYSLLPACINQCVWDIGDDETGDIGGDVAIHLSCSAPWINGCYCRPQSATVAHSFISSCATYLCSSPQQSDIDAGTSVYASYCSQALGAAYTPVGIEQADATPTAATDATDTMFVPAISRATSTVATQTSSAAASSQPSAGSAGALEEQSDDKIAGLSKAAFIGVVVSATCSVAGLVFGIWFKVHKHRAQMRLAQQNSHMNYREK